jgi:hypothetical protein
MTGQGLPQQAAPSGHFRNSHSLTWRTPVSVVPPSPTGAPHLQHLCGMQHSWQASDQRDVQPGQRAADTAPGGQCAVAGQERQALNVCMVAAQHEARIRDRLRHQS